MPFSLADVPDLAGRTMVITGANSGVGFEAARALARKGARVVLACRNPERMGHAARLIQAEIPDARVEQITLDLASFVSIREAGSELLERFPTIDVLVNNAGVMHLPMRQTADGLEMQMGTNHFGHFLLTALLMPAIEAGRGRVVTVSSMLHRRGRIVLDELAKPEHYDPYTVYSSSKLANLLFALELERRLRAAGRSARSFACHPGYSATNLQLAGPRMANSAMMAWVNGWLNAAFAMPAVDGALATVVAAGHPTLHGGAYVGPSGWFETRGPPEIIEPSETARDPELAAALWQLSERVTDQLFVP